MLFLHDIYHIIRMEQDNLYNLLQSIDTPDDLRHLSADKLPEVCKELRQKIIDELSCNPGHFGSSLGVIELTVALHYVFNTPYDRIVWDVGHQAYGHKILTGRRDAFCTNRKLNGIRPFPSPSESEYDTFIYLRACVKFYFRSFGYGCSSQKTRREQPACRCRNW